MSTNGETFWIVNLFQRLFGLALPSFSVSKATYLSLLCAQQEVRVCFVRELKQQANQSEQRLGTVAVMLSRSPAVFVN